MTSYNSLLAVENLIVTTNRITGDLASCAVQQSPYVVPDNLAEVLTKFAALWPNDGIEGFACKTWASMGLLEKQLDETFRAIPELTAWNERKNGREGMGFSSRYDSPSPDDDFIDLDALSRNVAMSAWADAVEFKRFNDAFEAKHGPLSAADA